MAPLDARPRAERLRVVDDQHVVWPHVPQQRLRVGATHVLVQRAIPRGELLLRRAVDHVVDPLRQREELLPVGLHHQPAHVDSEVAHEGNLRRQELGNAAALRRGVHVPHRPAFQARDDRLRDLAERIDRARELPDGRVVVEREGDVGFDELVSG